MLRRAFSLCAVLGLASSAYAGAAITLNAAGPSNPAIGYQPGEVVRVDVLAQLTAGSPATIRVRLMQFDLSDSSPSLGIAPVFNHPLAEIGPVPFWNFGGSNICAGDETQCGTNYFVDGNIASDDILNITYTGLVTSSLFMITLNQTAPKLVGSLDVTMPSDPAGGNFILDVLNADNTDLNFGAEIRHGFGVIADPGSFLLRAQTGEIVGATASFAVIPEPATLALLSLGGLAAAFRRRRSA